MERVETLLQKLQQQFNEGASAAQLLLTVQMLQHELAHVQAAEPGTATASVTISMPVEPVVSQSQSIEGQPEAKTEDKPAKEEKIIEVLQIDEAEVEAELEEIKRNAAIMQKISMKSKPQLLFDPIDEDIPTLAHQNYSNSKEINQSAAMEMDIASVNDTLKETKTELSEKLNETPVKDLKKAIGVNDRFLYINELFRGDEAMYERSIKTINGFSIWPEAEYWIRRELKTKLGWIDNNEIVKQFDLLVKRRFS